MTGLYGNYTDANLGFTGDIPPGASIENNIRRMLEYCQSHSYRETCEWWYDHVRNNAVRSDGHREMSLTESMDYKQIDGKYANYGNYNYAVMAKVLGFPDLGITVTLY